MGVMDDINQMMIEEMIHGALQHVEDKGLIKEKASEFLGHLDKIDEKMVVVICRVKGNVSVSIGKKTDIEFNSQPNFIDVETMLKEIAERL